MCKKFLLYAWVSKAYVYIHVLYMLALFIRINHCHGHGHTKCILSISSERKSPIEFNTYIHACMHAYIHTCPLLPGIPTRTRGRALVRRTICMHHAYILYWHMYAIFSNIHACPNMFHSHAGICSCIIHTCMNIHMYIMLSNIHACLQTCRQVLHSCWIWSHVSRSSMLLK